MKVNMGVAPSGPGHSAEPEPQSVSALRASVPNAGLAAAMAAAFAEIEAATKEAENPAFKQGGKAIKYADLGAVIAAIKPALIAHDLYFTQRPEPSENGVCIETVIGHASGAEMSLGKLFVPANKNDAQGFGSALTYARRYALVTAFGVPVEDDDGNAASRPKQEPRRLSDADWAMLVQLVETTSTDTAKLCKAYKADSLRDFTPQQFADAKVVLEKRLKQMTAKEPANA